MVVQLIDHSLIKLLLVGGVEVVGIVAGEVVVVVPAKGFLPFLLVVGRLVGREVEQRQDGNHRLGQHLKIIPQPFVGRLGHIDDVQNHVAFADLFEGQKIVPEFLAGTEKLFDVFDHAGLALGFNRQAGILKARRIEQFEIRLAMQNELGVVNVFGRARFIADGPEFVVAGEGADDGSLPVVGMAGHGDDDRILVDFFEVLKTIIDRRNRGHREAIKSIRGVIKGWHGHCFEWL